MIKYKDAFVPFIVACTLAFSCTAAEFPAEDHSLLIQSCRPCHGENAPNRHDESKDCSFCHRGPDWSLRPVFSHNGQVDCKSCHKRPSRHRTGKCIFCHDTVDWASAS